MWTEKNEIDLSNDGDKTLKNFLNYRRKVLVKDHPNDNAQLLTKVQFEGGVVGKKIENVFSTSFANKSLIRFSIDNFIRQSIEGSNLHI